MLFSNKYATVLLNAIAVFFGAWAIDRFHSRTSGSVIRGIIVAILTSMAIYYFEEKAKKKKAEKLISQ